MGLLNRKNHVPPKARNPRPKGAQKDVGPVRRYGDKTDWVSWHTPNPEVYIGPKAPKARKRGR